MKRSTITGSAAAFFGLGFAATLLAAQPAATGTAGQPSPAENKVAAAVQPAQKCLTDLRAFDDQMEKDGYWLGGSGYGYGYPLEGYGFGPPMVDGRAEAAGIGYQNARPGYELRTLVSAAEILAQRGQQQPCEDVLATTRDIYQVYVDDMHSGRVPMADVQGWRRQQIAAAQPVTGTNSPFRLDQLVGTGVRSPQNEALGSVEDLVMSPKTGKIAYLVIGRGGIFGIDEKYVPVPWEAFKITPNVKLLVLDTTKGILDAAPLVKRDQFAAPGNYDEQSRKVDAYWKTHLSDKGKG
jgi:sporulation protein YlmC with PRC-barrel domain